MKRQELDECIQDWTEEVPVELGWDDDEEDEDTDFDEDEDEEWDDDEEDD